MRTTLDLDADVLAAARAVARLEGRSLGRVVSALARRGLQPPQAEGDDDFPTFKVPAGTPVFGPEEVAAALDEAGWSAEHDGAP